MPPAPRPAPLPRDVLYAGSVAFGLGGLTYGLAHPAALVTCSLPVLLWCVVARLLPEVNPRDPRSWGLAPARPGLRLANEGVVFGCGIALLFAAVRGLPAPQRTPDLDPPSRAPAVEAMLESLAAESGRYPTRDELAAALGDDVRPRLVGYTSGRLAPARAVLEGEPASPAGTQVGPGHAAIAGRFDGTTYGALVYDRTPRGEACVLYEIGHGIGLPPVALVKLAAPHRLVPPIHHQHPQPPDIR